MTERSRVRGSAGAAGEFSSPRSTFCADSYFSIRSKFNQTNVTLSPKRSFFATRNVGVDVTKWPDIHHPQFSQLEQGFLRVFCFVPAAHNCPMGVFSGGDEFWYYTRRVCVSRCFCFFVKFSLSFFFFVTH